ncbi:MAG TPA: hypothetical protein DDX71_00515, partial [Ruminococcus sp.]|nr:hypothetical protein [Ruminococcus sp.]
MAQGIRKRLLSFATAGVLALSGLPPVSLGSPLIASAASLTDSEPAFYMTDLFSSNAAHVKVMYQDATGAAKAAQVDEQRYYMLVDIADATMHFDNATGVTTFDDDYKHTYTLTEIGGGEEWISTGLNLPAAEDTRRVYSMAGYILKNTGDSPLTLEDALALNQCEQTDEIAGRSILYDRQYHYSGLDYEYGRNTVELTAFSGVIADINVYTYGGEGLTYVQSDPPTANYVALVTATPRGTTTPQQWAIVPITPETPNAGADHSGEYYTEHLEITDFYQYDRDGASTDMQGPLIQNFDVDIRVYRSDDPLETYADCMDHGIDTIPGYTFDKSINGKKLDVSITQNDLSFGVDFEFDEPTTITEADNLYLLVKVLHTGGYNDYYTYYYQQITVDNATELSIPIQTTDSQKWVDENGTLLPNERISRDKGVTVELYKGTEPLTFANLKSKEKCSPVKNGGVYKTYATFYSRSTEEDAAAARTAVTETISFKTLDASNDYDFKDILGPGLYYGIVADRFEQGANSSDGGSSTTDIQSNVSANHYMAHDGCVINPNLTVNNPGSVVIAKYVDFNGETEIIDGTTVFYGLDELAALPEGENAPNAGHVDIDDTGKNNKAAYLYTDSEDRLKVVRPESPVQITVETPDDITKNRVEPIIEYMESISAELLSHDVPSISHSDENLNFTLDASAYPDDATIYIDGDALAEAMGGEIGNGKIKLRKKEHQLFVFNFKNTEDLAITRYDLEILKDDGTVLEMNSQPSTTRDTQNENLDAYVTRYVVWNLASVKNLEVSTAAGIFLLPDEHSVVRNDGNAATGWIITDGYIGLSKEWHFVYSGLPEDIPFVISKESVGGEKIADNATFQLTSKTDGVTFDGVTDGEGNSIGTGTSVELTGTKFELLGLQDGIYELEETAAPNGYTTVSTFTFEIKNGMVVKDSISAVTDGEVERLAGGGTLIVKDEKEGPAIRLVKTDMDGNAVNGTVKFKLSIEAQNAIIGPPAANAPTLEGVIVGGTEIKDKVREYTFTGSNVKIKNLKTLPDAAPYWRYSITEEEAPAGYEKLPGKIVLKFSETDGTISFSKSTKDEVKRYCSISDDGVTLTVKNEKSNDGPKTIQVNKQAVGGEPIAEGNKAQFTLTALEGGTLAGVVIGEVTLTDADTTYTFDGNNAEMKGLSNGTYKLEEKVAPDGYTVVTSGFTFKVTDGEIDRSSITAETTGAGIYAPDGKTIIVADDASSVKINKFDVTNQAPLKGAKIVVTLTEGTKNANASLANVKVEGAMVTPDHGVVQDDSSITFYSSETDVTLTGLPDGKYTLQETADEGDTFEVNDTIYNVIDSFVTFEIKDGVVISAADSKNGDLTSTVNGQGYYRTDNKFTVADAEAASGAVRFQKLAADTNAALANAKLVLTAPEGKDLTKVKTALGSLIDADTAINVIQWTTSDTALVITGLPTGTYQLSETFAPNGYRKAEVQEISIVDGKLADTTDETSTVTVTDEIMKLTVKKTGKNDAALAGAEFNLVDGTGAVVAELKQDAQKSLTEWSLEKISNGIYTLVETAVPDGYVKMADLTIHIADGIVTEATNDVLTLTNELTKVSVTKTDMGGTELPGATIRIIDKNGQIVEEWVSTEKAHIIEGLTAGETYTLHEEGAPDGYSYAEDAEFTVKADGTLTDIQMKDAPTKVTVSKQDATTSEEIPGAKLEVYKAADVNEDGTVKEGAKPVDSWISEAGKSHEIQKLTAGADYVLIETTVPDGYAQAEAVKFTVNRDNTVTQVVMLDAPLREIEIDKATLGGEPIA